MDMFMIFCYHNTTDISDIWDINIYIFNEKTWYDINQCLNLLKRFLLDYE